MNIAYIQGQESEALEFFERKLQVTRNREEQLQLIELVERLRKIIANRGQSTPDYSMHGLSLKFGK